MNYMYNKLTTSKLSQWSI